MEFLPCLGLCCYHLCCGLGLMLPCQPALTKSILSCRAAMGWVWGTTQLQCLQLRAVTATKLLESFCYISLTRLIFQGIEAIIEAFTAISLLSRSALWKGNESLAFKERAESITRLTINADLFMSRSNNCGNHTDFQKKSWQRSHPWNRGENYSTFQSLWLRQSWPRTSSFRAFCLLLAKGWNCSTFACPQERGGLD